MWIGGQLASDIGAICARAVFLVPAEPSWDRKGIVRMD